MNTTLTSDSPALAVSRGFDRNFILATVSLVSLFAALQPVRSATILSDDFSAVGAIHSSSPDMGPTTWSANSLFSSNGATLGFVNSVGTSRMATIDFGADYFVDNQDIYQLSLAVNLSTSTATSWWAIGFSQTTSTTDDGFNTDNPGQPWMLFRQNGGVAVFSGPGTSGSLLSSPPVFATDAPHVLRLVLNTIPAMWTLDAYVDDTQLDLNGASLGDTFTYSSNPVIRHVGISSNISNSTGAARADNISLDTIPEPNSLCLMILALGAFCSSSRRLLRRAG